MAVDTRNKRASCFAFGGAWEEIYPNPDGTVSASDRAHSAGSYPGITPISGTIDTRDKRASILGFDGAWQTVYPNPDASINSVFDRRQTLDSYRLEAAVGIAAQAQAVASAVVALSTGLPLAALGAAVAGSQGTLTGPSSLLAASVGGVATATPGLTTGVRLAVIARGLATASAQVFNRAPVTITVPTITFTQGVPETISLAGYGSDPDFDPLVLIFSQGPQGLPGGGSVTYNQATKSLVYSGAQLGIPTGQQVATDFHRLVFDDSIGLGALARAQTQVLQALTSQVQQLAAIARAQANVPLAQVTNPADLTAQRGGVATATGNLTTQKRFAVLASGNAAASGTLTSVGALQASAVAEALAFAELSGGAGGILAVAAGNASASASLTTQVRVSAFAAANASAVRATLGPNPILEAIAAAIATGSANLTARGKGGVWEPEAPSVPPVVVPPEPEEDVWVKEPELEEV